MKTINCKGLVPIRYGKRGLKRFISRLMPLILFCLMTSPALAVDEKMAYYTAYPPFLPRIVSPNILFMLDYSKSMVKPAYGTCTSLTGISDCRYTFSNLTYDYDSTVNYTGYFDTTSTDTLSSDKYSCTGGASAVCVKSDSGTWRGNFLNWLTMTQFDVMQKVTTGGAITPAPEQTSASNPTLNSILTTDYKFRKTVNLPDSGNSSSCSSTDSPHCTQWPTATYSWVSRGGGANPSCNGTNNTTSAGCDLWISSAVGSSYDNFASGAQTLPFPFTLYGTTYNQIYISTNGLLSFDPTLATSDSSLLNDNVEAGEGSWTATGLWHRETSDSCATPQSGSAMWYYGQNSTCNYNNGAANSGYLTSASIALPAGQAARLAFWYATRTEGLVDSYDKRFVQISTNGGASWTDLAQIKDEDDPLVWREKVIDLTAYAGLSIKLRFYFDTVNDDDNDKKGWFIDDIDVTSSVPSSASTDASNLDLPNSTDPDALIAPYWDDLIVKGKNTGGAADKWTSKVYTFTSGSAPNRIFVVTYENVRHKLDDAETTTAKNMTFQVLLYEGSNHIVFQYNDVKGATTYGGGKSATVGIENSNGSGAKKHSYCTACASVALTNSQAIFATPHVSYTVTASSSQPTTFQPAAPLAVTANNYNVKVTVCKDGYSGGECNRTYTGNYYYYYYDDSKNGYYDHEMTGLLQTFRDAERSGTIGFRLGIMTLNGSSSVDDGGSMVKHFNEKDDSNWSSLMNAIRGGNPKTVTPLAESLQIVEGYFKNDTAFNMGLGSANSWDPAKINTSSCSSTGNNFDPYCFQSAAQRVSCCKSFVLVVSSGNYSDDNRTNIYGDAADTHGQLISDAWRITPDEASGSEGLLAKGGWLDDVAYKAHTTDWRSDLEGNQNLTIYTVNTFGSGSGNGMGVLKRASKFGGFEDVDGDSAYDADKYNKVSGVCTKVVSGGGTYGEDDSNCDGEPDTYFEASGGSDLKDKIEEAVSKILKSSASGTSVSVLSTSAGGEGAIYQAYFYPAKTEGMTEERSWPGYLRAFFLDNKQNLRDDYSGGTPDAKLVMADDRIVQMSLNTTTNAVDVNLYTDADGVAPFTAAGSTTMDEIMSIWEAGKKLALRDKSSRHIYTWLNTGGTALSTTTDGFSSIGGTAKDFTTSEASSLKFYLRAQAGDVDSAGSLSAFTAEKEAEYIIRFTRGEAITPTTTSADSTGVNYRNRCISISGATAESGCTGTQRVWTLGDIVYSTPTLVSSPGEKYDQIYGDAKYREFANKYRTRRSVVYVGANDGMLHAFNAGVYTGGDDSSTTTVVETGRFSANPSSGNGWTSPTPALGDELWAFVPYDDLPHLGWVACNGTSTAPTACKSAQYTHVFHVDQRPKATDVRIFNNTASSDCPEGSSGLIDGQSGACHPGGWGTILIVPLRLGGGAIDVDLNGDGDTVDSGEQSFRSAYYVFDITDPEKKPKLLWRYTHADLGFTTSYPAIARICSDGSNPCTGVEKWYMVFGSGPKNGTGENNRDYAGTGNTQPLKVFVLDLTDGSPAQIIQFEGTGSTFTMMGDPAVVDGNLDFTSDVIYIGANITTSTSPNKASGRVYRINTNGDIPTITEWDKSTLFDPVAGTAASTVDSDPDNGKDMGPLLVSPSVAKDSINNLWVFFGTGRLKNSSYDLGNTDQQRFYGIKDGCWNGLTASDCNVTAVNTNTRTGDKVYQLADLLNASPVVISTTTGATQVSGSTLACGGVAECGYSTLVNTVRNTYKGWYKDMAKDSSGTVPSERVLSRSVVLGGLLLFTAYQPATDMCSIFGDSKLYALYYETGTAYIKPVVPQSSSDTEVADSYDLGKGMPTAVGVAIGETMTGFVQKSTGEIFRIEAQPGLSVKSGAAAWREKTGGSGTSEVEMIYKHIVK